MRILLVGGVPRRNYRGPVNWIGHQFEMIRHSFDRIVSFNMAADNDKAIVDVGEMKNFVESTRGYDAVFCEAPEALILSREREKRGEPVMPILALEVHGLKRVNAMRVWYSEHEGYDPWLEMIEAPWIVWIAASSANKDALLAAGVASNRIFRIDAGATAYSMFLPNADFLLDGGPEVDGDAADGLPEDGVVIPGSGRRDPECYLRAAKMLPDVPFTVVDEQVAHHRRRLAGTGLAKLPNVRWMTAITLESYIALIKRARLVLIVLQPGSGDGGHTTVTLAHRLGTAIVCSDVPGIADYVHDGYNARLVAPDDSKSLAEAIRELWNDEKTRSVLAKNGRKTETVRARVCRENLLQAIESAVAALP